MMENFKKKFLDFSRVYREETIIFFVSLLVNLIVTLVLWRVWGADLFLFSNEDSHDYLSIAGHLARGEGFLMYGNLSAVRTPLYPLFLFLILLIKIPLWSVAVLQGLISSFSAVIIYKTGRLIFSPRVGILASGLFILEPNSLLAANTITTETIFIFFSVLFAYFFCLFYFSDRSRKTLFLSAVFLGLAVLARPVALFLPLLVLLFLFLGRLSFGRNFKTVFFSSLIFIFGFVLTIAPWSLRQYQVFGTSKLSNIDTFMLYAKVLPIVVSAERGVDYDSAGRFLLEVELPEKISGFDPRLMQDTFIYDDFLKKDALSRIKNNPLPVAKFYAYSLLPALFGGGYDYALSDFGLERFGSRPSFTSQLFSGDFRAFLKDFFKLDLFQLAVIAGALIWLFFYLALIFGLIKSRRAGLPREAIIFIVLLAAYFIFFALGPQGHARYRLPAYPFLFLLISYGLTLLFSGPRIPTASVGATN